MPVIPFAKGFEGSEHLPHTRRSLTNCFNNGQGQVISRPGITSITTTGLVARGQFVWNERLYQVASNSLLKFTDPTTGTFTTNSATVSDRANVDVSIGFNAAVILVPGTTIYTLDSTDTLTLISSNTNFVPCASHTFINGRRVYIPTSGDPAFYSDVGAAGTVQASSFFDAEELPDKNKVTFNLNNTLYIGGTDSFELFRNVASDIVFQRIEGASITTGYIGGLLEYDRTFFFIGRKKNQVPGIFRIGQGDAPRISNEAIDLILTDYSEEELSEAVGGRFIWRGYDIATFKLKRDTFGYFNGNWFILNTISDLEGDIWQGGFIAQFEGEYYTSFNANFGRLDRVNTDYGLPVSKIIDIGFEQEDNDFFTCQTLGMDISQGFTSLTEQFGPDLVTNGTFDTDLTGWTDNSSAGGAIAQNSGKMDITNTSGTARGQQSVTVEIGGMYKVTFTASGVTNTFAQQVYLGSTDQGGEYFNAERLTNATRTLVIEATSTLLSISFRSFAAGTTFSIDDVIAVEALDLASPTVGIFMSKDNVNYGPGIFRDVGALGEYTKHLEWNEPGGLGMYDGFMGIRIYTTQDIDFAVDKMFASFR